MKRAGEKFGRLVLLKKVGKANDGHLIWECLCACGNKTLIASNNIGKTKSCGCLHIEKTIKRSLKHGMKGTKFYRAWMNMKSRVNYKKDISYKNYGGRGIKICEEWYDFKNFYNDLYERYKNHCSWHGARQTTLDRKDNNGNYCKDNCRWATYKIQRHNRRKK